MKFRSGCFVQNNAVQYEQRSDVVSNGIVPGAWNVFLWKLFKEYSYQRSLLMCIRHPIVPLPPPPHPQPAPFPPQICQNYKSDGLLQHSWRCFSLHLFAFVCICFGIRVGDVRLIDGLDRFINCIYRLLIALIGRFLNLLIINGISLLIHGTHRWSIVFVCESNAFIWY